MTVLYSNPCYNKVCYKGTALENILTWVIMVAFGWFVHRGPAHFLVDLWHILSEKSIYNLILTTEYLTRWASMGLCG